MRGEGVSLVFLLEYMCINSGEGKPVRPNLSERSTATMAGGLNTLRVVQIHLGICKVSSCVCLHASQGSNGFLALGTSINSGIEGACADSAGRTHSLTAVCVELASRQAGKMLGIKCYTCRPPPSAFCCNRSCNRSAPGRSIQAQSIQASGSHQLYRQAVTASP